MVQPVHGFQSWFLDVGQGDGVFLRTRDEAILSDCGSSQDKKIGKNVLGPFLKSQGIRTLDWILVSHADADHTNGIEWLLKEEADIRVRNLHFRRQEKGRRHIKNWKLLPENGVRKSIICIGEKRCGRKAWRFGACTRRQGEKPVEERNSHSLVFDITYGKFRMLLTGDIGVEDERKILAVEEDKKREKVTLLKAAHHGSNGSSSEEFWSAFPQLSRCSLMEREILTGTGIRRPMERLEQTGNGDLENGGFRGSECVDGRETYVYQGI